MSRRGAVLRKRVGRLTQKPAVRVSAGALVVGATLAGFLVPVATSPTHARSALLEQPITVKRALSTTAALFGDRVEAEVDVYTADSAIDPASVRIQTDFRPYRAAATRIDRSTRDGMSLLRSRTVLVCLTRRCLAPSGGRSLQFRPVTVAFRRAGRKRSLEILWQPLETLSRAPSGSGAQAGIVDTAPPLDSGFPRSPALLQAGLILAAVALTLAGLALVVPALWPHAPRLRRRRTPPSRLEQLLLELETAARIGDEAKRRSVLDQLATSLSTLPSPALEAHTRSLAWGATVPEPDMLLGLAERVRTSVNGALRR